MPQKAIVLNQFQIKKNFYGWFFRKNMLQQSDMFVCSVWNGCNFVLSHHPGAEKIMFNCLC